MHILKVLKWRTAVIWMAQAVWSCHILKAKHCQPWLALERVTTKEGTPPWVQAMANHLTLVLALKTLQHLRRSTTTWWHFPPPKNPPTPRPSIYLKLADHWWIITHLLPTCYVTAVKQDSKASEHLYYSMSESCMKGLFMVYIKYERAIHWQ